LQLVNWLNMLTICHIVYIKEDTIKKHNLGIYLIKIQNLHGKLVMREIHHELQKVVQNVFKNAEET